MRAKIIACATVAETIREFIPADVPCTSLEFGLHLSPDRLRAELQRAIDGTEAEIDTVLLGYGLCSRGTVGLRAGRCRIVIPRVDDCISLFMGSQQRYRERFFARPGTFYLTRGWIECGDDPYTEYLKLCERFDEAKAYRLEKMVIQHYTHLALIRTGETNMERYQAYARRVASFFGLQYEEIEGSPRLALGLLQGGWGEDFAVVQPGEVSQPDARDAPRPPGAGLVPKAGG